MKSVFIGGSRRLSRLNAEVRGRLDDVMAKQLAVVIGDANGADKAVQSYLMESRFPHVRVFCTGGGCRNNLGNWTLVAIKPPHRTRDFEYFTAKDAAMAEEADYGLMLWDGESAGTLVNVARLVSAGKPVVLYTAPSRSFLTLRTRTDLEQLLGGCPDEVRGRVTHYISQHAPEFAQHAMF